MPTLDWIGKDKVINHHKDVPYKVLERKYSFDESGMHKDDIHSNNMIIHGDNLEEQRKSKGECRTEPRKSRQG